MKKIISLLFITSTLFVSFTLTIQAHPGRLDGNGGHYNRSTGEYHYHDGLSDSGSGGDSSKDYNEIVMPINTPKPSATPTPKPTATPTPESEQKTKFRIPKLSYQAIMVIACTALITILFLWYKIKNSIQKRKIQEKINKLSVLIKQIRENQLEAIMLKTKYKNHINNINEISKITLPDYVKIENNKVIPATAVNIITEKDGQKLITPHTFYIASRKGCVHAKLGCSGAYLRIDVFKDNYRFNSHSLCMRCTNCVDKDVLSTISEIKSMEYSYQHNKKRLNEIKDKAEYISKTINAQISELKTHKNFDKNDINYIKEMPKLKKSYINIQKEINALIKEGDHE